MVATLDSKICVNRSMRTYNVKLVFENPNEKIRMDKTLRLQRECWNFVSEQNFFKSPKGVKELHDLVYHKCREKFPDLPAQYVVRAYNDVKATYKTIKSNRHDIFVPAKKKNLSVRLDKRIYSIKGESIFVTACDGKKVQLNFTPYPKLQEFLDKKIPCDPLLFKKDGQYWLSLSFREAEKPIKENKVLGIDLGEKRIFATSEDKIFIDKNFNKNKRKLRFLKRTLQSKKTKSAKRKLKKLKRKERNQNKNQTHLIANELLKTEANILVLEDLKGIKQKILKKNKDKGKFGRKRNNKFSQIPIANLVKVLQYKAGLVGKQVVKVDAAYTSQEDHRGLKNGQRVKTRYYAVDGKLLDADVNAAINIANRYIKKNKLPISFGKFKFPGIYGQAVVNRPNVCQSRKRITSHNPLGCGS